MQEYRIYFAGLQLAGLSIEAATREEAQKIAERKYHANYRGKPVVALRFADGDEVTAAKRASKVA